MKLAISSTAVYSLRIRFAQACIFFTLLLGVIPSSASASTLPVQEEKPATVPDMTRPRPATFKQPAIIEFKGQIDRRLTTYFNNRFDAAKRAGADLLIIEIDSPGGLRDQSLQMAERLRDCKWAYTIAIISNEAISGGALVALGCDEIMINPTAKFGDIGQIEFNRMTGVLRLIEPKIESYLSLAARSLAESKGRSPDLAEALIDKDVLVYVKENGVDENGKPKLAFTAVRVETQAKPDEPWRLVPESGAERFLTLSGQRTVELGLGQGDKHTREEAAEEFAFPSNKLIVYQMQMTDKVINILSNPWMSGLLVLIGLIALYFELSAPGISVGGLMAGLCAVLFFWSRFMGGTSGWLEVILFVAGIIFLFMELFVIPGFGVSGLTGLVLLFSSVILAGQDFVFPQTAEQWNQTLTSMLIMVCSGVAFLIAAVFMSKRIGSLPLFNRMILTPRPLESDSEKNAGKPVPQQHPEVSVGDWGKTESLLRPAGRAKFGGHSFDVISDGAFVEPDTQVRVIRIKGNIITVEKIDEDESNS